MGNVSWSFLDVDILVCMSSGRDVVGLLGTG